METTLRVLVGLGLTFLLVLLRLDAERFGAAEYDEARDGRSPSIGRRIAWYGLGIGIIAAILWIHPSPGRDLFLRFGDRGQAILFGFLAAALGAGQAAAYAWYHYRHLRLPEVSSYPGAILNAVATAFIDEAAFRGALLGFLVLVGLNTNLAIVMAAIVYVLATRLGAPGRGPYMLALAIGIGLVAGWVTVATGGIAAAFLGHAVTRFSVFLWTGHAGRPAPRGAEVEDVERRRQTPDGWRAVGAPRER